VINVNYAKAILNVLFHTNGSAGNTPDQEMAELVSQNIYMTGCPASDYFEAFKKDKYKTTGPSTAALNDKKKIVNSTRWFYTVSTESETFKYENESGVPKTINLSGWAIEKRDVPNNYYPQNAYLALFTTMPDENGQNYVEPVADGSGVKTTYMRVNLKEGIITGGASIVSAYKDEETGEATLVNGEMIMFPEIYGASWGTIVGFGVFEKEETETGDTPIYWGRLSNPITSSTNHVPLFRIGNFKVTLQ
jgi:hypothetical protein